MSARHIAAALALTLGVGAGAPVLAQAVGTDALIRMQELEDEVRQLNGRLEKLEHRLQQVTDDATQRIGDLESRVFELEGNDPSLLGDPVPLGGGARVQQTGSVSAPAAVAVSEQSAFDAAVRRVQTGDPEGGRQALQSFRRDYPDSPLSGKAQHWIAESLFLSGDYRTAAQTYLANVSSHPKGELAGESLIGLALSLEKLGQLNEACLTLAEAPRRAPGDDQTLTRAAEASARLQCP